MRDKGKPSHYRPEEFSDEPNRQKIQSTGNDDEVEVKDDWLLDVYNINNDPERKVFLDDLSKFMREHGIPIDKKPIVNKSLVDIFTFYRLVVANGGLVQVLTNKRMKWISDKLNLSKYGTNTPYLLRNLYTKYLFPYECKNENFSTREELQQTIERNRRYNRNTNEESNHSVSSSIRSSNSSDRLPGPSHRYQPATPSVPNRSSSFVIKSANSSIDSAYSSSFATSTRTSTSSDDVIDLSKKSNTTTASVPSQPQEKYISPAAPQMVVYSRANSIDSQETQSGSSPQVQVAPKQDQIAFSMNVNGTIYSGVLYSSDLIAKSIAATNQTQSKP